MMKRICLLIMIVYQVCIISGLPHDLEKTEDERQLNDNSNNKMNKDFKAQNRTDNTRLNNNNLIANLMPLTQPGADADRFYRALAVSLTHGFVGVSYAAFIYHAYQYLEHVIEGIGTTEEEKLNKLNHIPNIIHGVLPFTDKKNHGHRKAPRPTIKHKNFQALRPYQAINPHQALGAHRPFKQLQSRDDKHKYPNQISSYASYNRSDDTGFKDTIYNNSFAFQEWMTLECREKSVCYLGRASADDVILAEYLLQKRHDLMNDKWFTAAWDAGTNLKNCNLLYPKCQYNMNDLFNLKKE